MYVHHDVINKLITCGYTIHAPLHTMKELSTNLPLYTHSNRLLKERNLKIKFEMGLSA